MPVTDPIADMLTRIRNAITIRHEAVTMPTSKIKVEIARILREQGFISGFDLIDEAGPQGSIRIYLHYRSRDESSIHGLKRVSRPGLRVYVGKGEIPRYYGGIAVSLVSTSQGVMTGREAWRNGVGGELLCYVW